MSFNLLKTLVPELCEKFAKVKMLLTDVDGVLTDATIFVGENIELKRFNVLDGLGMRLLMENGIKVGWISARPSPATQKRAEELKVDYLVQQRGDKVPAAEEILKKEGITWDEVCYIGDDIVDIGMLKKAGVPATVRKGHPIARKYATYVTKGKGGQGAVREIAELILTAKGLWNYE